MAKNTKKKRAKQSASAAKPPATAPESRSLGIMAVLAGLSALWSAFQWNELLTLRGGGEIFCALGPGAACAQLADSAFAVALQELTGLPVPGWGLVWSGAALAMALGALARRGADGSEEPLWSASLWTAAAGVASVLVLVAVSLSEGGFCSNCVITYALVLAYAGVAGLRMSRTKGSAQLDAGSGAGVATLAAAIGFVALLYPGLQTPFPADEQAKAALSKALAAHKPAAAVDHSGHAHSQGIDTSLSGSADLEALMESLSPDMKQAFSDSLAVYAASRSGESHPPRALHGPADAPVLITDFTDTLCGHCASLHAALAQMYEQLPAGSFAIDSRHFPLDGNCNPQINRRQPDPVRCVSAAAQICMEGNPDAFEFAGLLYQNQRTLDSNGVYELAGRYVNRSTLRACVELPETQAKLQADIAWAESQGIRGTPLVLINGRRGSAFAPFLFAMVSTEGQTDHSAFSQLPPPRPPSL